MARAPRSRRRGQPAGADEVWRPRRVCTPGGPRLRRLVNLRDPDAASPRRRLRPASDNAGAQATSNWIISAFCPNGSGGPITSFSATWIVPQPPTAQNNQLIYLFNGLQPADGSAIVQPVLQWGDHGADADGVNRSGSFWTVSCWHVAADGSATHSRHLPVNAGDVLTGTISLKDQGPAGFVYDCIFENIAGASFTTDPISELTTCVVTLEAYDQPTSASPPYELSDKGEYPPDPMTNFANLAIAAGPNPVGAWQQDNFVNTFGEHTAISADGRSIQLYYR